jgi:hypothetical protein
MKLVVCKVQRPLDADSHVHPMPHVGDVRSLHVEYVVVSSVAEHHKRHETCADFPINVRHFVNALGKACFSQLLNF